MKALREFLETWKKRRTGELPPVDFRMNCSLCGRQIIGDAGIQFGKAGLISGSCSKKEP